jgi:hypothetical protein
MKFEVGNGLTFSMLENKIEVIIMLELRPNCECYNQDLPPESTDAVICTFICAYHQTMLGFAFSAQNQKL